MGLQGGLHYAYNHGDMCILIFAVQEHPMNYMPSTQCLFHIFPTLPSLFFMPGNTVVILSITCQLCFRLHYAMLRN